jgi:chitin-binding protein
MIYAIWQTTSTPDTYYSCADVVFTAPAPAARPPAAPRPQAPAVPAPRVPAEQSPVPQLPDPEATGVIEAQPVAPVAPQSPPDLAPQPDPSSVAVSTVSAGQPNVLGTSLLVGALAAALALGGLLAVRQYRSRRG